MGIDFEIFNKLFLFDNEYGVITRKVGRGSQRAGDCPGTIDRYGYLVIKVNGKSYFAHRVAWLLSYKAWPQGMLDHKDGDKLNNVISNLREVDSSQNQKNRKMTITNTSGVNGVVFHKRLCKWQAQAFSRRKLIYLGQYELFFDAVAARKSFEIRNGYSYRHGACTA